MIRMNPTTSTLAHASPYLRPLPRDVELEPDPLQLRLDFHRESGRAIPREVDVVIDPLWNGPAVAALHALRNGGRLVHLGTAAGLSPARRLPDALRRAGRAATGSWRPRPDALDLTDPAPSPPHAGRPVPAGSQPPVAAAPPPHGAHNRSVPAAGASCAPTALPAAGTPDPGDK